MIFSIIKNICKLDRYPSENILEKIPKYSNTNKISYINRYFFMFKNFFFLIHIIKIVVYFI